MLQDTWALKAQREGYRSRAVYKLEEILVKVKYNNQSCKVLDIGCAPGGWSDYLIKKYPCLLYTSPSPRDAHESRMPSSA